jgi:transcriptional regulator with XRE-family HTH domain
MSAKTPRLVGQFIRQRREALGLSQRALGLLFNPAVTTQFISNIERGVTPLPPTHVPTLVAALKVEEAELLGLLEREYTAKLSDRLGKAHLHPGANSPHLTDSSVPQLILSTGDADFMKNLYEAYRQADPKTREAFAHVAESILPLPKGKGSGKDDERQD